jgi:cytochrome c oxidase subunit 4
VTLTVLTVFLAEFDFGSLSVLVTLLIAGTKASLVFGVFMHLWFDNKFYALVVSTSFVFLSLFILFPIMDMGSRDLVNPERGNYVYRDQRVFDHTSKDPEALPLRPGLKDPDKDKLVFEEPHH